MDPRLLQQIEQYLRDSGLNAQELKKRMDEVKASTTEFNRELQNAQRHFADLNSDFNDLSKQFKNVLDDLRKWDSTSNRINKSFKTLGGIADKLKYDAQEINVLNVKDLNSLEKKARVELNNLKARKAELDAKFKGMSMDGVALIAAQTKNKDLAKQASQYIELNGLIDKNGQLTNDENNYLKTLLGLIAKRQKEEKDINRTLGISGKIIDGIIGSLGKLGISSDFFENLKEDMRDAAKSGDKWKVVTTATKGLIQGIGQALKDPVTQLTILLKIANFFIKAALTANAQVVQLGKSLGSSSEEYRENLVKVERTSNNLNVTTKNLVAAFDELVTATGYVGRFSADALETQIMLTKQFGLTGDEAAGVFRFSQLTGKSSKAVNDAMVGAFVATRNSLKAGIPFKAAIAEAAKVSGVLSSNFQNDPKRIAAAVVQAKALGTSLEQTAKQGEALLNFESSIESELKAELLTGKQLNLERARAAALAGDQVTLAEELVKNVGSIEEFDRMNVLQKKALAESVGLTTDELAKQLQNQKLAQETGKSLAQITKEQALEEQKRQDVQTKFNAAVEKLQSLFGNLMAGPLGSFLDALSAGLGLINKMIPALKIISGIYLIIKGFQIAGNILEAGKTAQLALQGDALATQNIMQEKGLVKKAMYHAIAIKEAVTEGGIASVKAYALSLDEKSLARRIIISGLTAKEWLWEKGKAAWKLIQLGYDRVSLTLKSAAAVIEKGNLLKSIGSAMMGVIESLSAIPIVGWALGLAAAGGVAALGYKFLTGDDIMSEGGYGKRTLLAPEGAIRLNDKDTVIAGTDLGSGNGGGMPSIDLTPMISAINEVKVAVDNLMNRPVVINMDGKKVGSGLVQGSYKMA
jgi:ABC-type transporter Mla subunit MlaD